jgi:hypothetical protein
MGDHGDGTLDVLRSVWAADDAARAELDEECGPTKSCKNMKDVTFDGYAEPGDDLSGAWRERLAREGKLSASEGSIRDLVLGSSDPR